MSKFIDYRALLKKYMEHIIIVEGTTFLDKSHPKGETLSVEEFKLLLIIQAEINEGE